MNRKTTPFLLLALVLLGLLAFIMERPRSRPESSSQSEAYGARVLAISQADVLRVRVKRDYWNSYTLGKTPDGSWRLTDPSDEPASEPAVRKLLATVENLPALTTINLPASDSERHREYGLLKPVLELTVSTPDADHSVSFGTQTADNKGVYCARYGQDKVYVTAPEAMQVLSLDLAAYRQEKAAP